MARQIQDTQHRRNKLRNFTTSDRSLTLKVIYIYIYIYIYILTYSMVQSPS